MNSNEQNILTDEQLRKSYWLVVHARDIHLWSRRAGMSAVVVIGIIAILSLGVAVIGAASRTQAVIEPLISHANHVFPVLTPDPPRIRENGVIDRGSGIYDLYAVIENAHTDWRADSDVVFTVGDADQLPVRATFFPGDKKYVILYGITSTSSQARSVRIEHTAWKRLTADERTRVQERKNILIAGFSYESGRTGTGDVLAGTRARFVLENTSAYDFFDFPLQVVLIHGSSPVAATTIPVFSLRRNQKLPVEARWEYVFAANEYDITPYVDPLDAHSVRPAL